MLVAIFHFIADEAEPAQILATLLGALPAGSYLVASHGTHEHDPVGPAAGQAPYRASGVTGEPGTPTSSPSWRSPASNSCRRA